VKHIIAIETKLQPFLVPEYVTHEAPPKARQDGFSLAPRIPLGELSDETLDALCAQFRTTIFAKATEQRKVAEKASLMGRAA
jgi:hypothetical protein